MNRIFKTVWSRTKNMYVVVSEIVNSCGKSKGGHVIDIKAAFAAVLILTSSALGQGVQAKGHEAVELGGAQAQGLRSVALGNGAKAEKQFSTAVGYQADAKEDDSTAYGYKAIATGLSSTALGNGAEAKEKWSTAVGSLAHAYEVYSTAVGQGAQVTGQDSTAVGSVAEATGRDSTALGKGAKAEKNFSTALGNDAQALVDGSVALGKGSVALIDKGVFGYDPFTGKASTETSAIWRATQAAFSVGSTEDENNLITRQITGVAAGTKDTDAVNVAQLKALEKKLIAVLPEVVGDQHTGIVVEKNPKENTSTPSTGGTTSLTGVTTSPAGGTIPPMSGTTRSTGETTTAPADASKTVYKVKLDKKVDVGNISIDGTENKETITIGKGDNNVIVNNTGLTIAKGPSVTNVGINAGNKKITNVADATEDSDAVNYKQLKQATQGMNEMFGEINRVGAHSAALAALQPLDFDPYNRSQIMAGVSTYKGQQAIALGVAHYSNENTLVHAGLSYAGESDLMANVGISINLVQKKIKNIFTKEIKNCRNIKMVR